MSLDEHGPVTLHEQDLVHLQTTQTIPSHAERMDALRARQTADEEKRRMARIEQATEDAAMALTRLSVIDPGLCRHEALTAVEQSIHRMSPDDQTDALLATAHQVLQLLSRDRPKHYFFLVSRLAIEAHKALPDSEKPAAEAAIMKEVTP